MTDHRFLNGAPDDLRFELRVVAAKAYGLRDNFSGERSDEIVDAILVMPEMQAIREVLRRVGVRAEADADVRWGLLWNELPASVRRWATAP